MAIWTLGLNHRSAPLDVREKFSFAADRMVNTLQNLRHNFSVENEAAILSTCNRTEIYCAAPTEQIQETMDWLASTAGVSVSVLASHAY